MVSMNNLAWVFVADASFQQKPARTYETLRKKLPQVVYFTPNVFFSRKSKDKNSLRWINAFFVDIDDPAMSILDLFDVVRDAGLPEPSLINKTTHGWHVFWKIQRVRATIKALRLYETLQKKIVAALGADPRAASAEHFMRIPYAIEYLAKSEYIMQDFVDWLDINEPTWRSEKYPGAVVTSGRDLMNHPAIQELLQGVEEGRRNNTCFTLALAMMSAGFTQDQTLRELTAWNFQNQPSLPYSQIRASVRSAFSGKYHAPSANAISELSGIEFHHRVIRRGSASDDGSRKRDHYISMAETREKFLVWLSGQGGQVTTQHSQSEIACELNLKRRSLCLVLKQLRAEGVLSVEVHRLGRGQTETTYALICAESDEKEEVRVCYTLWNRYPG